MKSFDMENGDIVFNGRDIVMIDGIHQLAQEAEMSFGTKKGEWILDEEEGMRFDALYKKPFNEDEFKMDLIESLYGTTEELSVMEIEISNITPDRQASVDVVMIAESGESIKLEDLEVNIS